MYPEENGDGHCPCKIVIKVCKIGTVEGGRKTVIMIMDICRCGTGLPVSGIQTHC